jgi:excisionase family DNA binding protein
MANRPVTARTLPEPQLSVEQLAALWSVSRDTIERLIASGALRSVRIATMRRIPASAIAEYLAREAAYANAEPEADGAEPGT